MGTKITHDDLPRDALYEKVNTIADEKQDSLSESQLNAVNSGITASKVSTYDNYATGKANTSDVYTKTEIDSKLGTVYKAKGSKANYASLPSSGNTVGDVWNVLDTGANYVWTGTEWDKLSETVDLSGYALKTELQNYVAKTGDETINGTKTFNEPIIATIKSGYGGFEYAQAAANETSKYCKLFSIESVGTFNVAELQAMVNLTNRDPSIGFMEIKTRVHDTAGKNSDSKVAFSLMTKEFSDVNFYQNTRLYYWNDYKENTVKYELWMLVPAWTTATISVIDTISKESTRRQWNIFSKNNQYDSFPTDASGYIQATLNVLKSATPTEDTTTSTQVDTVGARNTKLQSYQPLLTSGTNIKTVNGNSLLGSGDIGNLVTTNTAQTITGAKTFSNFINITGNFDASGTMVYKLSDNNDKGFIFNTAYYTENQVYHRMSTYNKTSGKFAYLDVINTDDGNYYGYLGGDATLNIPTSDNTKKIITTQWFNQKIQYVSTLPASPDSNVYYFTPDI